MGKFVWICGTGGAGGMDGTWGTEGRTPVRTVYSGSSAVFGICGSFASSDTSCGVAEATRGRTMGSVARARALSSLLRNAASASCWKVSEVSSGSGWFAELEMTISNAARM